MRSPSSPGALVSQEKFPGNVGFPPRQVAIYRNEVNAAPAGRELEGGGNNYVHGEGTGPDQALVPANSSRHLPGAGRDLWGLSAAVAEGDPALQAMKMLVRPSRPPRGASLLQTAGQVFLQVLWSARSWWRGSLGSLRARQAAAVPREGEMATRPRPALLLGLQAPGAEGEQPESE